MSTWICRACGTQYPESPTPPTACAVCADERQFVPAAGQRWTTLDQLRAEHRNSFRRLEPNLMGIGTVPDFAIGQRALLVQTPQGNVLWDCIALLDDATVDIIRALGGLATIAISHPHFYTTMVEWAHVFRCPILLHGADREHVARVDPVIEFWGGDTRPLLPGLTLIRLGGHFAGGTVLHWAAGADGRGALLSGDTVQVVADTRWVSFMRSYPNLIPLPASTVSRMAARLESLAFDRLYGAWWDRHVASDARGAVLRSAKRYTRALTGGE